MEVTKLQVSRREAVGSNPVRALRRQGQVPGVLYGHRQDPLPVATDHKELVRALQHHAHFLELDMGGTIETAVIREVQYDTYGQHVVHVDFMRVDADEPVEVEVAVELRGHAKGVTEGGVLELHMAHVTIRCAPRLIPEVIAVPVADLALHQAVAVKDLVLPQGAVPVDDPEKKVCSVVGRAAEAAPVEGAEAEPEVVGKKPAAGTNEG